ncbi:MAG TPA: hypothetical protein PKD85_04245 [Saprospiraceae bacterium]|nr:hypothetical protein [Saprospiraceae bacterium]
MLNTSYFELPENCILIIKNGKLQRIDPPPIIKSRYGFPYSAAPILEDLDNRKFVLLAHLLQSTLICPCMITKHFGLFRNTKLECYRIKIRISSMIEWWNDEEYPINRIKCETTAILIEGIEKWFTSGKMKKFINREYQKCLEKGCFKTTT